MRGAVPAGLLALALVVAPAAAADRHPWTRAGHLRIGVVRTVDTLNPLLSTQAAVSDLADFVFSGLIRYDDRGNPVPDVAREIPSRANGGISPDGRTLVYRLRRDVTFSDGAPLTADDVVFTWQQVRNPANNVPNRFPYDLAQSVVARDRYTVVVRLREPSAPFLAEFFRCGTDGAILPKHLLAGKHDLNRDPYNARPVGSGPFVVESYVPGNAVELRANPHYFRGRPRLDRITYRIIPNENSLLVALRAHEIDLYDGAPEQQAAALREIPGVRVAITAVDNREQLVFNTRKPPFDDVRVRKAAIAAIDWSRIQRSVYLGIGLPGGNATDVFPLLWAYTPALDPYPHDPARAAAWLDEAGWKAGPDGMRTRDGQPLSAEIVTVAGVIPRQNAELQIQQELRAVGVDLTIRNAPANLLFAPYAAGGLLQTGKFDLAIFGWSTIPDPDDTDTLGPGRVPPAGVNDSGLQDAEIGRLQALAARTYDRGVRKPLYARLERRIAEVLPYRTIVWRAVIDAYDDDLHGFRPVPGGSNYWNAWEWAL